MKTHVALLDSISMDSSENDYSCIFCSFCLLWDVLGSARRVAGVNLSYDCRFIFFSTKSLLLL